MTQLATLRHFPALRSMFDNFMSTPYMDDDLATRNWLPAVNVKETEKNYEIEVAAPGFRKEDIRVNVEDNVLTISAEKREEKENKKEENYTRREFSHTSFSRSFSLPPNVNDGDIKAHYEDGILRLTIEKAKEQKPQRKTIPLS